MANENEATDYRHLLHQGVLKFKRSVYDADPAAYQSLADKQHPHTLLITCSDSRVCPEAFTSAGPGQIFVSRNVGNLVPPYGESDNAVAAVVEYAVAVLKVKQVVVCGHSNCGAMKGLLNRSAVASLRAVDRWLTHGDSAISTVQARHGELQGEAALGDLIRENVLQQLAHLKTYPVVAAGIANGSLQLIGWVFDIGKGEVEEYDPASHRFRPV